MPSSKLTPAETGVDIEQSPELESHIVLSPERITTYELCPRRMAWTERYSTPFVAPMRALHYALDAGLTTTHPDPERVAESRVLELARSPGLDLIGNVYSLAMHYAKLAGILTALLRSPSPDPWQHVEPVEYEDSFTWRSACYMVPGGELPVRVALVDRWTDDRKRAEVAGWRTVGEVCALESPLTLTAINVGPAIHQRRHSAWTRCYRHPRNRTFRFQRRHSEEDFSKNWAKLWREDCDLPTRDWLHKMHEDGCMDSLVAHVTVPIPPRRAAYLLELERMAREIDNLPATPSLRLSGCWGLSPCPFTAVCPGTDPLRWGFRLRTPSLGEPHQAPSPVVPDNGNTNLRRNTPLTVHSG